MNGLPIASAFKITADVERWSDRDRYGERSLLSRHRVAGCVYVPGAANEAGEWVSTLTDVGLLLAPYRADLAPSDRVRLPNLDGEWEIDGNPTAYRSPISGHGRGKQATIRRVEG